MARRDRWAGSRPCFPRIRTQASVRQAVSFRRLRDEFLPGGSRRRLLDAAYRGAQYALPASELLLFPQLCQLDSSELQAVVISRSGRTSEAVRAAKLLVQTYKVHTLGITCAPESELSNACHSTLALAAANEKSMVMTRSFTSMLLGLIQLAASRSRNGVSAPSFEAIASALSARIEKFSQRVEAFVARNSFADYIYLAQGPFFAVAREAALKITEMSCSYAQAYHTLEFRHGPKSIVSPQTCLTFFLSESGMQEEMEVLAEIRSSAALSLQSVTVQPIS